MIGPGSYMYVCRTASEVPAAAYKRFPPELGQVLGSGVATMFPAFAEAFPLTAVAMGAYWSRPVACLEEMWGDWIATIALEREDRNLFFDLRSRTFEREGVFYDQDHAMLPPRWRELYRWFQSFVITEQSVKPMRWLNTPRSYSSRLDLEELRKAVGARRADALALRDRIGSNGLMCWMLTDRGDALLLDEERCDRKVYHVRGKRLSDVSVLEDGSEELDRYLALLVAGDPAVATFDFSHP